MVLHTWPIGNEEHSSANAEFNSKRSRVRLAANLERGRGAGGVTVAANTMRMIVVALRNFLCAIPRTGVANDSMTIVTTSATQKWDEERNDD
jgi:hypothetical protein